MAGRTFTAPDGRRWHVRRRWLPRLPRWRWIWPNRLRKPATKREKVARGLDIAQALTEPGAILAFAVFLLLLNILFPFVGWLIDLLIVLVVSVVGLLARVLFRRPWTIEAVSSRPRETVRWHVVGWSAGAQALDEIATALRAGREPPRATASGARLVGSHAEPGS